MNQQDITIQKRARKSRARTEWPTLIGLIATVVVIVFQGQLFNDLSDTPLALVKFLGARGESRDAPHAGCGEPR